MTIYKCAICKHAFDEPYESTVEYREYSGAGLQRDTTNHCPKCGSNHIVDLEWTPKAAIENPNGYAAGLMHMLNSTKEN